MKKTTIELPIKYDGFGGEAWVIADVEERAVDCPDLISNKCPYDKCKFRNESLGVDGKLSHRYVEHCNIESIEISAYDGKLEYTYNGCIDGHDVYATRVEAEAALAGERLQAIEEEVK